MSDTKKQKKSQGNFNITLYKDNAKFIGNRVENGNITKVAAINECVEFASKNEKLYADFLVSKLAKSLQTTNS